MSDSGGRLIRKRESSMEDNGWCCCGEHGGFHRERRLRRVVDLLALACVLLLLVTLALVVTFVLVVRDEPASVKQPIKQPAGDAERQQLKDLKNPRAMLTAPTDNNSNGDYLQWESHSGRAFCQGGFNYSAGSLLVPQTGMYRVFLQITYEMNLDYTELILLNKVYYYSDDYPKDKCILSSVDTVMRCTTDCDEQWSKSLYTAGMFELKANAVLRVTSSHPQLIVQNEDMVFFGAERLPP